ncbi:hypothetical protein ACX3P1_08630 [Mesorhizobium sp. A623]
MTTDDYRFVRWLASHNTHRRIDDPEFDKAAQKLSEKGWEALSKDEQKLFDAAQMANIGAEAQPDGINLECWARLEGGIGDIKITSFAVDNDPNWGSSDFDETYEKTFTKLKVTILSSAEEHPGFLWVWSKSLRENSRDDDMPDEDVLYAQFYMLPEKLKALARDIAAQPTKPTLTLHAEGLMFRDEVDESLSEPWHPREYVIIYDHHVPAVLNSIRFNIPSSPAIVTPSETCGDIDASTPSGFSPQSVPTSEPRSEPIDKHLKGLKYALWILAAAVILAALIR